MEKINLQEDRDFFTREFRNAIGKGIINESTGGYLWNLLGSLEKEIEGLQNGRSASGVSNNNIMHINRALGILRNTMKKELKGKGLSGW